MSSNFVLKIAIALSSVTCSGIASAKSYMECQREEASNLGLAVAIINIPKTDTIQLLRGAIVGADFSIKVWSQCIDDQQSIDRLNGYIKQREKTVEACKKLAAIDTCLKSPF